MKRIALLLTILIVIAASVPASVRAQGIAEPTTLVDAVLRDLSARLNRQVTRVTVTYQYNYSRYADASLGCPEPGKTYTQTSTVGWQVLITPSFGGNYDYRALNENTFWLCVNGQGQPPIQSGQAPQPAQPVVPQPT